MLSWRYPEDDEVRVARVGSKSAPRVLIRRKQTQTLRRFEDRCRHEGLSQKEYQGLLKTLTSYRSQRLLAYILQREHRSSDTSLPGSKFPVSKPENKSLLVEVTEFVEPCYSSPMSLIHTTNSFPQTSIFSSQKNIIW